MIVTNYGYLPVYFNIADADGDLMYWTATAYYSPWYNNGTGTFQSYPIATGSGYDGTKYATWTPPTTLGGTFYIIVSVNDGQLWGTDYVLNFTLNVRPTVTTFYPMNNSVINNYGYNTYVSFLLDDGDGDMMNWTATAYYNPYYNGGAGTWQTMALGSGTSANGYQYALWNLSSNMTGTWYIIISASDGLTTGYGYIWNITLNAVPTVTVYYPHDNQQITNYGYVPVSFNLADADNDTLSWTVTAIYNPYYNNGSGTYQVYNIASGTGAPGNQYTLWNVNTSLSGVFYFMVQVNDGNGYGFAYIMNVTLVRPANVAPTVSISSPSANSVISNTGSIGVTFDIYDADNDPVSWEVKAFYHPYYNNNTGSFTTYTIGSGSGNSGIHTETWTLNTSLGGVYYFQVLANDGTAYGYDYVMNVTLVPTSRLVTNNAPSVSLLTDLGGKTFPTDQTIPVSFEVEDEDMDEVSWSMKAVYTPWDNDDNGDLQEYEITRGSGTPDVRNVNWHPNLMPAGVYLIEIMVDDGIDQAAVYAFDITLTEPEIDEPVVEPIPEPEPEPEVDPDPESQETDAFAGGDLERQSTPGFSVLISVSALGGGMAVAFFRRRV